MGASDFSADELDFLKTLNTPEKLQDYVDSIHYNYCENGYICKSPKRVLRENNAHCFEGSLFIASVRRINGHIPFVIDMQGIENDDHVIVPFKKKGLWGAMAQSRTYTLKWRDPIYKSLRELVLSYFPFFIKRNIPVLRTYTEPIDLTIYDYMNWETTDNCLEELGDKLTESPHKNLFPNNLQIRQVPLELEQILNRWKK